MSANSDPRAPSRQTTFDRGRRSFDPALDAGLAAAFGPDPTPGGWSQPPLLRDDPSDHAPLVQPSSPEMPRGGSTATSSSARSPAAAWAWSSRAATPTSAATWPSRCSRPSWPGKPAAEQRFVEEAQIGGQLQHPGIVPVYDLGPFADGRPFFAMKLVKGRTLADLLAEPAATRRADRGRFLQIFLQVCQTVAYAHAEGVIHRDLKPSNVMVGAFGEVQVMDWGLAKVLPARRRRRRGDGATRRADGEPRPDGGADGHPHGPVRERVGDGAPGACWARRRTCPRSRPAARSTSSTSGPTCSASGRSSA